MNDQNYSEPEKDTSLSVNEEPLYREGARFHVQQAVDNHLAPSAPSNVGAAPAFQSLLKELGPDEKIYGQFIAGANSAGFEAPKKSVAFLLTDHRLLYGYRGLFRTHRRSLAYSDIESIKSHQAGNLGTILIDAGADSMQILTQSKSQTENVMALLRKTLDRVRTQREKQESLPQPSENKDHTE